MKEFDKKVDKYLTEFVEAGGGTEDAAMSSLTTGIRRIQYKLQRANTPQKYTEAFEMVAALVASFPLKSKIIWGAVADAHNQRFGGGEI